MDDGSRTYRCDVVVYPRERRAEDAGRALASTLNNNGKSAFLYEVPPDQPISDNVMQKLSCCTLVVIMDTRADGNDTRPELRAIINDKPAFRIDVADAQHQRSDDAPDKTSGFVWTLFSNVQPTVPTRLVHKILAKLQTLDSVTGFGGDASSHDLNRSLPPPPLPPPPLPTDNKDSDNAGNRAASKPKPQPQPAQPPQPPPRPSRPHGTAPPLSPVKGNAATTKGTVPLPPDSNDDGDRFFYSAATNVMHQRTNMNHQAARPTPLYDMQWLADNHHHHDRDTPPEAATQPMPPPSHARTPPPKPPRRRNNPRAKTAAPPRPIAAFQCCLPPAMRKTSVERARDNKVVRAKKRLAQPSLRLLYLTPNAIVYMHPIKRGAKSFSIRPRDKLAFKLEERRLTIKNGDNDTLRLYAPTAHDSSTHLQQWVAALNAAQTWEGNDGMMLPSFIKGNHEFAQAMWRAIFGGFGRPEYRDVWLRWLCRDSEQTTTLNTIHRLFTHLVKVEHEPDTAAEQAAAYLNLLVHLNHSVHTRMIVNAIEPRSKLLESWQEHTIVTTGTNNTSAASSAINKCALFSMLVVYIHRQAEYALQRDPSWPFLLCMALDYDPAILRDKPVNPAERAAALLRQDALILLQDANKPEPLANGRDDDDIPDDEGDEHDSDYHTNGSGSNRDDTGEPSPFDADTLMAMKVEEERLSRAREDVCSVPLTCFEELAYFFDADHLRYFACKHWAQNNIDRYIAYLRGEDAAVLKRVFDGPQLKGKDKERLCLLLPCLDVTLPEEQAAIIRTFTECGGLHMGTFRLFVHACVDKGKTGLLAFCLRAYFSVRAESIQDAVGDLLSILAQPQGAGLPHAMAKVLFDAVVVLVGSNVVCVDSFERWAATCTDAQMAKLVRLIYMYAVTDLCRITRANRTWLDAAADREEFDALHARVNDDSMAVEFAYERTQTEFQLILIGFVRICLLLGCYAELQAWADKVGEPVFQLCFGEGLRMMTIEALDRRFKHVLPECKDMIMSGTILVKPHFFCQAACDAMTRDKAVGVDKLRDTYFDLLAVAEKLDGYATFAEDMRHLLSRLLPHKAKTILSNLNRLCDVVTRGGSADVGGAAAVGDGSSDSDDIGGHANGSVSSQGVGGNAALWDRRAAGLKLGELVQCSLFATDAIFIVQSFRSRNLLEGCIAHYVDNCHPSTWVELFRRLDVIAFFINYLVRESYEKAFVEFKRNNPKEDNAWANSLLGLVRLQFDAPIINLEDLRVEEEEAQARIIEGVLARSASASDAEMAFIIEFTGRWMRRMKDIVSIPMTPHNTQIITTLMFTTFYRLVERGATDELGVEGSRLRSLIAEVGTGEGKSVIIIMMALYFVCVHGRRVHIMENNVSLLDRDYNNYRAFFSQFKKRDGTSVTASTVISREADITYCLQIDVERAHLHEAPKGHNVFEGLVLIVDEVDDLVIENNPVNAFVKRDEDNSPHVHKCFQALKRSGLRASKPAGCPSHVWNRARGACREVQGWREGRDYALMDGSYCILNERGRPKADQTSLALEYLNFVSGYNDSPSFKTTNYVIATPHVFKQYAFILGLTGSVGGEAEREYLQSTYDAGVFSVPPFLNTCTDARKREPHQHLLKVVDGAQQQRAEVASVVEENIDSVPVLVISPTPDEAQAVARQLRAQLGGERVQLLLELVDGVSQKDRWQTTIDQATQPMQHIDTVGGGWRVTVTDYFGGRGHDYKVTDEGVDDAGGMLVIITHIPDSYREWVQWKGRTARQDRNGQLALILNSAEAFMRQHREVVEQFKDGALSGAEFVERLLHERNMEKKEVLDKYAETQRNGMAVNEMCDRFYRRYGAGTVWPENDLHRKLRDFLEKHGRKPPISQTRAMATELGIADNFPY
ncbi:hypothetical protein PTSG_00915 [Salpingoeca rosetta]|uniref:SecA family profile domain-containing protein n=1 Tax=Salpingoeca rosetta (strain ATCC 50818 / BSB-021) TaxID=946362 RepID=F2TXV3_SALR5|nr:uncharacterized protein PTSG_00915 [Salpingoeca rosetta]EGD76212.1 hypothetical protein PTSG_00915 [Salpingoeca rosetta]|eukprot:XP_004998387.1 hypothetical protein PTSG_00915 [Salpingoeca rosetta]